jgi:hypothetical protein
VKSKNGHYRNNENRPESANSPKAKHSVFFDLVSLFTVAEIERGHFRPTLANQPVSQIGQYQDSANKELLPKSLPMADRPTKERPDNATTGQ